MNNFLEVPTHYELVEEVKLNVRDILPRQYNIKGDPLPVIKWCRANFGNRGDGWDFHNMGKGKYIVEIWSSRLVTIWLLWQK